MKHKLLGEIKEDDILIRTNKIFGVETFCVQIQRQFVEFEHCHTL